MLLTEQEEGAAAGSCKNPLQITTPTGGSCYCPETDNMMECMCACGACVWSECVFLWPRSRIWVSGSVWVQLNQLDHVVLVTEETLCFFLHNRNLITYMIFFFTRGQKRWNYFHFFEVKVMCSLSVKCLWTLCQSNTKLTHSLTSNHSFQAPAIATRQC